MKIKYHPAVVISIYVDGRVEVYHNDASNIREAIKLRMIKNAIRESQARLVEELAPGDYRMKLTEFSLLFKKYEFTLKNESE